MKHALQFREAIADEADLIADMHTQSWRNAYRGILSDAYLASQIADERRTFWRARFAAPKPERRMTLLAEQDAAPVGFVCVLLDEDPPWGALLDNLHVLPVTQRTGVGRELLRRAGAWVAEREPIWPMHLFVFEANEPARRFYDALEGEVVQRQLEPAPDGREHWILRYVWHKPGAIA